ncbi:MAG: hypothetical protein ACI9LT_002600 [Pseudoalteromonas distincta]|jgi:hypothetical protein
MIIRTTLPAILLTGLIAACSPAGETATEAPTDAAEAAPAAAETAAPVHEDDDVAEPVESAEEHGHEHDGDDADHPH